MAWASLMVVERTGTLPHPPRTSLKRRVSIIFPALAQRLSALENHSPAGRFPNLFVLSSSSCLLVLSRVVLRSLTFPVPLDTVTERDCVFGAAIPIVLNGSRRFVLVVVVARTATVMSGGAHAGLLWSKTNAGMAKQAPPFRYRQVVMWCPALQSNHPG